MVVSFPVPFSPHFYPSSTPSSRPLLMESCQGIIAIARVTYRVYHM